MIKYQLKISDHIHLGISSNMWGALLAELGQQKSPKRILSTNQNQSSPSPEHLITTLQLLVDISSESTGDGYDTYPGGTSSIRTS